MTISASAIADRKTFGQGSLRVATRCQSFNLPNMISITARQCISQRCHERGDCGVCIGACHIWQVSFAAAGLGCKRVPPLSFNASLMPIGIITAIIQKPFNVWKAAQQGACANLVADLSGGDKEADRASLAVANGMLFGIHAARFQGI